LGGKPRGHRKKKEEKLWSAKTGQCWADELGRNFDLELNGRRAGKKCEARLLKGAIPLRKEYGNYTKRGQSERGGNQTKDAERKRNDCFGRRGE